MVFNVVANNRDDHAKQHAFLMSQRGIWDLAPSFDLTFSRGPGTEHYLAVKGRAGDDITAELMIELGREHGIAAAASRQIIDRAIDAVNRFEEFAQPYVMSGSTLSRGQPSAAIQYRSAHPLCIRRMTRIVASSRI